MRLTFVCMSGWVASVLGAVGDGEYQGREMGRGREGEGVVGEGMGLGDGDGMKLREASEGRARNL